MYYLFFFFYEICINHIIVAVEKHIAEKENQNEKIKKKNIASERQLSDLQVAYNINTECFQSQAERYNFIFK